MVLVVDVVDSQRVIDPAPNPPRAGGVGVVGVAENNVVILVLLLLQVNAPGGLGGWGGRVRD